MEQVREQRRIFHRYPETGWLTYFSSVYIANVLQTAGYDILIGKEILEGICCMDAPKEEEIEIAKTDAKKELQKYMEMEKIEYWLHRMENYTGVIARLDTGKEGLTRACRFDMDALFVAESQDASRIPVKENFTSRVEGVSHACGHDGHMAIGLSTALELAKKKDALTGTYFFIFQPAEEGVRGAKAFCEAWKYGKIDELYCLHIGFAPKDTFVAGAKGFLATTKFDVHFHGKSAHAGLAPERGRNALMAAARATVMMEKIERPKTGITRLNVGQLRAGESRNTIPAYAWLQMETRGETSELNEYMRTQSLACIKESAKKYGVTCDVEYKGESVNACSSKELSQKVLETAKDLGEFQSYQFTKDFGASDDGAVWMDMVQKQGGQAVYMLLGCETVGLNHETVFDFDEDVMEKAVLILMEMLQKND